MVLIILGWTQMCSNSFHIPIQSLYGGTEQNISYDKYMTVQNDIMSEMKQGGNYVV